MLDHIKSGADFMTTCLTTFRTGLLGDSSTQRILQQSFRTKKHVLDAISRKKLYLVAWGGRGRKFKRRWQRQRKSHQTKTRVTIAWFSLYNNNPDNTSSPELSAADNSGLFNKDRRDFCLPFGKRIVVTDGHIIYTADITASRGA